VRLSNLPGWIMKVFLSLWNILVLYRHAIIRWSPPRHAKIVVLDACGLRTLVPLFNGTSYEVVHVRGEVVHLTLPILVSTLRYLRRTHRPHAAYVLAMLEQIRPSVVVTTIDNSQVFTLASQHYSGARFVAVQNGVRCLERDFPEGTIPIHIPEFACFGEHDVEMYSRHGAKVGRYYPIGSLKDSYYRRTISAPAEPSFDLCLVSEVDPDLGDSYPEIVRSVEQLAEYLSRFCKSTNATLCVAARYNPDSELRAYAFEQQWVRAHFGSAIELVPNCSEDFSTYRMIDSAHVSLAFNSTALVEAFGRGQRSLFCNFTSEDYYDLPVAGVWSLRNPTYEEFSDRLSWLLTMTDAEFRNMSADAAKYVMSFDSNNPPHAFLEGLLADALGSARSSVPA
jgi:hypothetical protein